MNGYPNDVDDGHEHEWREPDDDMGVTGAIICIKCGFLSTEDEEGEGE